MDPGKKILGLSVHGPGGAAKPTAAQSAIRNSWTLLPIIPFIGGLLGVVAIVVIAVTINSSPPSRASTTSSPAAHRSSRFDRARDQMKIPSSSTSTSPSPTGWSSSPTSS